MNSGDPAVSPNVAKLIERVEARVAAAPTVQQIRDLAGKVMADSRENTLTIAEIRQLTDLAISRARLVEECAARLAELVSGAGGE